MPADNAALTVVLARTLWFNWLQNNLRLSSVDSVKHFIISSSSVCALHAVDRFNYGSPCRFMIYGCRPYSAARGHIFSLSLTSMHSFECWIGLRKKVPSTSGYRSYTNIISLHKMHVMWVFLWAARDERTNILVSSLPCLPSSSICNDKKKMMMFKKCSNFISFQFFLLLFRSKSRRTVVGGRRKEITRIRCNKSRKKFLMNIDESFCVLFPRNSHSRRHWTSSLCSII